MTNVREKAKPYFLDAQSSTLAILIHGFTGTPNDLRELAKFLVSQGLSVKVPLLPGHGSHWADLEKTSYFDWWKTIDDEVKQAMGKYDRIFLIGYSFGANLALDMAARYPQYITGVVSLGISVFLRREFLVKLCLPFFHFFMKRYRKFYISKERQPAYEDSGAYAIVPTKSLYDFYYFINHYTRKELGKVKTPVLVIHSRDDAVTHPMSSQFVYDRLGTQRKELVYLDDVNHNPISSERRNLIFGRINRFVDSFEREE